MDFPTLSIKKIIPLAEDAMVNDSRWIAISRQALSTWQLLVATRPRTLARKSRRDLHESAIPIGLVIGPSRSVQGLPEQPWRRSTRARVSTRIKTIEASDNTRSARPGDKSSPVIVAIPRRGVPLRAALDKARATKPLVRVVACDDVRNLRIKGSDESGIEISIGINRNAFRIKGERYPSNGRDYRKERKRKSRNWSLLEG
jgi:hypothetical protein